MKFIITYRNEFSVEVEANNEKEARKKAIMSHNWELLNDVFDEFLEIEEI